MTIIGGALALGAVYFKPRSSPLEETASLLTAQLSRARVDAMLSRKKTTTEFDGDQIYQIDPDGSRRRAAALPPGTRISVNGRAVGVGRPHRAVFGPLGYAEEKIICLQSPEDAWTIYLPPLGAPLVRRGIRGVDELRKETP